jgi:hypothetical protein
MKLYAINTTKAVNEINLVTLFIKIFEILGIKVNPRITAPIKIKTELLERFPVDPVWYLRLIKPVANKA